MRELTSRRDQLIEAIAAEKKRLRRVSHEAVRSSLESQIASLEREVKRLEAVIAAAVPAEETTRITAGILESIPGVGKLTANLMAIDLPELGRLGDKQIASLAGVAPHPDESGKYRGRACIRGGRPRVRAKLYMAAFNARKYNPVIKAFYARLVAHWKQFQPAMTACMRTLLVLMNTLVARGQTWDPSHATRFRLQGPTSGRSARRSAPTNPDCAFCRNLYPQGRGRARPHPRPRRPCGSKAEDEAAARWADFTSPLGMEW